MDLNQARERVERLTEDLNRWTYEYYVLDNPSHTDAEFDQAMEELQRLEKEFPSLVSPTSPTQRVGIPSKRSAINVPCFPSGISLTKTKFVIGTAKSRMPST